MNISKLEAWSDTALNWMGFIQQDESWSDCFVVLFEVGSVGGFLLKHVTNAPYYLPTFTKTVLSEFGERWWEFGAEGGIGTTKSIALDHYKLKG